MTTTRTISNTDDIIDSRDVIARIEELEERFRCDCDPVGEVHAAECNCMADALDSDEEQELGILRDLAKQGEDYAPDWEYGEVMIADSYFEDYAQELASDVVEGYDLTKQVWPFTCIDWTQAARELQMDYTSIQFDGAAYWIR